MIRGKIKVIAQTWLKQSTQQSSEVPENQKQILHSGQELECLFLDEQNGHYRLDYQNEQWFVSKFHTAFEPEGQGSQGWNYFYLTRTSQKDEYGCFVLNLKLFENGVCVDEMQVCSGQPSKQYFRKGKDSISGSGEPMPEGVWLVGDIKWADGKDNYKGRVFADGVGPVSVPLQYVGYTSRSAIEVHPDWNRKRGKPGTVGCASPYDLETYKRIIVFLRRTDAKYFFVNWNLGTCPTIDSVFVKTEKKFETTLSILPECGVQLIKLFENCFLNAYPDPKTGSKPITIGWGCTVTEDNSEWKLGDVITQNRADTLLYNQLTNSYYANLARTIPYWDEMNEYQKGALLSFGYNLGALFMNAANFHTIQKALKNKDWQAVGEAILLYHNPRDLTVRLGLWRRRNAEKMVWEENLDPQLAFNKVQTMTRTW